MIFAHPRLRRPSLTFRLAGLFAATSLLLVGGIGVAVYLASDRHFVDQDTHDLHGRAAAIIAHQIAHGGGPPDFLQVNTDLLGHHPAAAEIVDAGGRQLSGHNAALFATAPAAVGGTVTFRHAGSTWRAIHLPLPPEASSTTDEFVAPLTLRLAINIDHHTRFLDMLVRSLLATGVAVTLLGLGLGYLAARRGLKPLDAITRRAADISASRLDARLDAAALPRELVPLADELNAMLARLDDSFRRLAEFSSDIAHELRTPVSNLMTETEVALTRTRSTDEYREVLSSNLEEFGRLSRMVNDMLFLAKADHGLVVPRREPINLADEVAALFDFYEALAAEASVTLRCHGSASLAGDRSMIRRALANLLSNALRHSARGSVVEVSLHAGPDTLTVDVDNPGEAIPAADLPRLFDRFYRADAARSAHGDGAGLGLAIVRSIVAAHGGTVRALRAGNNNRFRLEFPLAAAADRQHVHNFP